MTTAPSYRKTNPADAPVLLLAVNSKEMPASKVDDIAENVISPLLSTISGVAQVSIYGAKTYAVRVGLEPSLLQARNIGVDTVTTAIAQANNQVPVGALQNQSQRLTIDADTQRTNADEFKSLVIATANGAPIHLGDVANVQDGVDNPDSAARSMASLHHSRGPAPVGCQHRRCGESHSGQAAGATRAIAALDQHSCDERHVGCHQGCSIDVQFTLLLTIALVVLVIYLFTGHLTATIISGLAVPLSLIAAFGAMYVLGYSIDNISLLG